MLDKFKSIGSISIALSIVCLVFSIVYFTNEFRHWREQLPGMLQQTEQTAEKISPAVSEVAEVAELIPPILEEVTKAREVIRLLLEEVKASRELVPDKKGTVSFYLQFAQAD